MHRIVEQDADPAETTGKSMLYTNNPLYPIHPLYPRKKSVIQIAEVGMYAGALCQGLQIPTHNRLQICVTRDKSVLPVEQDADPAETTDKSMLYTNNPLYPVHPLYPRKKSNVQDAEVGMYAGVLCQGLQIPTHNRLQICVISKLWT